MLRSISDHGRTSVHTGEPCGRPSPKVPLHGQRVVLGLVEVSGYRQPYPCRIGFKRDRVNARQGPLPPEWVMLGSGCLSAELAG